MRAALQRSAQKECADFAAAKLALKNSLVGRGHARTLAQLLYAQGSLLNPFLCKESLGFHQLG